MEALTQRVDFALHRRFPDCELELDENFLPGRIGGRMIWSGFEGIELMDRYDMIRGALAKELSPDDAPKISLIYTFTPDEMAAILED